MLSKYIGTVWTISRLVKTVAVMALVTRVGWYTSRYYIELEVIITGGTVVTLVTVVTILTFVTICTAVTLI